jgi:hypothetical protein
MTKPYFSNPENEKWKTTSNIYSGISMQPVYGVEFLGGN